MLRLLAGVLTGLTIFAGCYSERLPPPYFRHSCTQDSHCDAAEQCIRGLCQIPCSQATASEDCPQTQGFVACLNGVCTSSCIMVEDACPGGQVCTNFGLDLADLLGGGGDFGGGDADELEGFGVCNEECMPGDCPGGETCLSGICVPMCDQAGEQTCPSGLMCSGGLCIPQSGESTTGTPTATDGDTLTGGATFTDGDPTLTEGDPTLTDGDSTLTDGDPTITDGAPTITDGGVTTGVSP